MYYKALLKETMADTGILDAVAKHGRDIDLNLFADKVDFDPYLLYLFNKGYN